MTTTETTTTTMTTAEADRRKWGMMFAGLTALSTFVPWATVLLITITGATTDRGALVLLLSFAAMAFFWGRHYRTAAVLGLVQLLLVVWFIGSVMATSDAAIPGVLQLGPVVALASIIGTIWAGIMARAGSDR